MVIGASARVAGLVVRMVVGFFMFPFLVDSLGAYWYGVYYATAGLVANFHLMDFGFANATMRETAMSLARSDDEGVNRTINTALRIYLGLAAIVLVLTILIVALAPMVMGTSENLATVRAVLFIIGIDVTLTFPTKALAGIVQARLRYDLLLVLEMTTFLLGVGASVWVLTHGYGVIALALITLTTGQLHNVLYVFLTKYLFQPLTFSWRRFDRKSGRTLASYSLWSFLFQLANQLRFRVDALTTGGLFGGEAITRYTIGSRLVEYAQSPMVLASNTALPALAAMHASDEHAKLSSNILFLLRCNLLLAVYAAGLVMFLGRPFIVRWMGAEHADSHQIASLLSIGFMTELFLMPLTNALLAAAKHRMLAIANCTEAAVNVALSIGLGYSFGLLGVAFGTVIPLLLVQLAWVAPYACRTLEISSARFFTLLLPAVMAIAVFLTIAVLARSLVDYDGYVGVILGGGAVTLVYWPTVLFCCVNRWDRQRLWNALPWRAVA